MRWDVHYVSETGSTNADLAALARGGAAPGRVLRAGHQTAGRGRLGRRWEAAPGTSLLASLLLPAEAVPFLAVARVALAAAEAGHDLTGIEITLKWPNDLLVGDLKLAGLLAETEGGSPTMVVGIGWNLVWPAAGPPPGLAERAVALADLVAIPPGSADLLDALLARLDRWLLRPPGEILSAYRQGCSTLGRRVALQLPGRVLAGTATGLTPEGELEVATAEGPEVVHVGDLVHLRADHLGAGPPTVASG